MPGLIFAKPVATGFFYSETGKLRRTGGCGKVFLEKINRIRGKREGLNFSFFVESFVGILTNLQEHVIIGEDFLMNLGVYLAGLIR